MNKKDSREPQMESSDNPDHKPETYYAPAARKSRKEIVTDIDKAVANPVITGLMTIANGLFAVLNEQRQVVAVNKAFLKMLGVDDVEKVLGLRYGECVKCVHSCDMPGGGCGTSEYCSSCGAAVAIMAGLDTRQPQERTCALTVERDQQEVDLYFNVRACPINLEGAWYVLFFLQDVTMQQHRSCLDRTFFHDINNILCGLIGKSQVLALQIKPAEEKIQDFQQIVIRIAHEIASHNALQKSLDSSYKPLYADVHAASLLEEIEKLFEDHPLKADKTLAVSYPADDLLLVTDCQLVSRIVTNMVTNALEATPAGGIVKLYSQEEPGSVTFHVWNRGVIPAEISKRIFQRNFSTKSAMGRGFGTYSMKLFGEQVLGGNVDFESSLESGTTFRLRLPKERSTGA